MNTITKKTGVSLALVLALGQGFLWFDGKKAEQKAVDKLETEVEKQEEVDKEHLKALEGVSRGLEAQQKMWESQQQIQGILLEKAMQVE